MAQNTNRPLKAYVRFDGTGRIVPSSLILRRKKPKVGKWVEIPAYECCNYVPTTTTTSTSTSSTTTTTTTTSAVFEQRGFAAFSAGVVCAEGGTPTTVYYSGSLGIGTTLWLDAGLTNAYLAGVNGSYIRLYFAAQSNQCVISGAGNNEIISYTAC